MANGDRALSQAHMVITAFDLDFVPVTDEHLGLFPNEQDWGKVTFLPSPLLPDILYVCVYTVIYIILLMKENTAVVDKVG